MTQLNKALLLCFSCVLLSWIFGCSSSNLLLPNGYLYLSNSARPGSMAAFNVTEGSLARIVDSPFVTNGNAPYSLASVSTKFLYAGVPATAKGGVITRVLGRTLTGSVPGGIMLLPIRDDHTLNLPQLYAGGGDYDPIAVPPGGGFLYAADLSANQLAEFSINSTSGALTGIGPQGPPPGVAVGPDPFNVVIDPQGKFVFVANCDFTNPSNKGSVSVFSINGDGTLTAVSGSPFLMGGGASHPAALAVSSDNSFLFVASLDDKVYVESISNGALTDLGSVALPTGSTPISIAVSFDGGNSIYTGNAGTKNVSFFLNCVQSTVQTGCMGVTAPLVLQTTGGGPVGGTVGVVLADPTSIAASSATSAINLGHFLYVTDYDHGLVLVYTVTSTTACTNWPNTTSCTPIPGTLTETGSAVATGGGNPFGLTMAH